MIWKSTWCRSECRSSAKKARSRRGLPSQLNNISALANLMNRSELASHINKLAPWFHYIDLGDGLFTKSESAIGEPVEHPRPTWDKVKVAVPSDLTGQTVLDVGCNAGFYSIEMH